MNESERPASTTPVGRAGRGGLLLAAAPLAAAIGVFGVIFGAAASAQMDAAKVGLAVQSIVASGGVLSDGATLAGALAAVIVAPFRSLLVCLIAGVAAYLAWGLAT